MTMLREDTSALTEGSYQWAVGGMLKSGRVIRTGSDEYMLAEGNALPEYKPSYSIHAAALLERAAVKLPYIDFTVFETVLLNDFLNHLMARKSLFIQVEKHTSAFVFRFLQEEDYANVMYKPSKKISAYIGQTAV